MSVSLETHQKFDFYAVGLTFAILGASIQTANPGSSGWRDGFELAGWFALLISGVIGLSRMERLPFLFAWHEEKEAAARRKTESRELAQTLEPTVDSPFISQDDRARARLAREEADRAESRERETSAGVDRGSETLEKRYGRQRWTFLLGIVMLFVARSWPLATSIGASLSGAPEGPRW